MSKLQEPNYLLDQTDFTFNDCLLIEDGWDSVPRRNHTLDYMWTEYQKRIHIQDMDGSYYDVIISLKEHENIALVYVNDRWIGRALTLEELAPVVESIKRMNHLESAIPSHKRR